MTAVTCRLVADSKEPNSRLPDYFLKINHVSIQIYFFKLLLIHNLEAENDTFNFEYISMYELSQSVRMIEIAKTSTNWNKSPITIFPNSEDLKEL